MLPSPAQRPPESPDRNDLLVNPSHLKFHCKQNSLPSYRLSYTFVGYTESGAGSGVKGAPSCFFAKRLCSKPATASASNGPTAGSNQVFRYDTATSTLKSLGTLGGVSATSDPNGGPYGINAAGNIAGFAKTSTGALHAFLYNGVNDVTTGLQLHDLGTLVPGATSTSVLSEAYGINTQGDVVGNSNFVGSGTGNALANFHAYVYKSGSAFGGAGLFDLNTAADLAGSGFTSFNLAYGINDSGWIIGQGITANGQSHAFLLKPVATSSVPEPSAILAMGMGLFGAGLALRRRVRK